MRLLVTAELTPEGLERLRAHADVVYEPWSQTGALWMSEELSERVAADAIDALVVEVDLVHDEVFEARPLRFVACCRGEPLNVDDETATEEGVPVLFTPGRNSRSVAELAIAFMLDLARGITPMQRRLSAGDYEPSSVKQLLEERGATPAFELGSATVGLLGFGAVAEETAKRLSGFGPRLIACDPHAPDARLHAHGVERVDLDTLFTASDVLSLHAALTPETRGIVSAERVASMRPGAFLINTARHRLVDADALYDALREGRLGGAGLDVFRAEPPLPNDRFLRLPNVVAMPHLGGATRDVVRHQTEMVVADIERLLRGEVPRHCVNPETLPKP
ncbi:MAG: NAD(P)-dependent oxidoreductase [Sandaracinaceae bacterium]